MYIGVCSWEILTAIVVIVIIALFFSANYGLGNLPPGPIRWPIVGNLGQMLTDTPTKVFQRLRQRYGDVFSLQIGKQLYVVLNGYDVIHDALVKQADDFSDRPNMYSLRTLSKGKGVLNCRGDLSPSLRGVCNPSINDFKRVEAFTRNEVTFLIDEINKWSGKPIDIHQKLFHSIMTIMCGILTDRTFPPDDQQFNSFVQLTRENINLTKITGILDIFPYLKNLPGDLFKAEVLRQNAEKTSQFCQFLVDECKKNPGQTNGVIPVFLQKQRQWKDMQSHPFTDDQLISTVNSVFSAGVLVPTATLLWAILHLVSDKDLQGQLRREILSVVGKVRFPSVNDQKKLPRFLSFIYENFRHNFVPIFALPHGAIKDFTFKGHTIPQGSIILPNLDSVMKDPNIFSNPQNFKPDRFLESTGEFVQNEKQISFSLGTRQCLGSKVGTDIIFVILASLIQRLELLEIDSKKPPSLKGTYGFTHDPKFYKIRTRQVI